MQPSLRHRLLNLLHSALLLAGMAAIAWISASAVAGPELAVYVLLGLVGGLIFAPVAPKEFLLSLYRARRLGARDFPDGVELLARLAARAGLPAVPALYYIPSSVPNAFALGGPADSAIAVTDGILRLLDRHEFAGVLAHEVAHIANRDLWLMGLADMMSRLTALLSYAGQIVLLLNLPLLLTGQVTVPWIAPLVLVFAPTIMSLLQLALSRTR
ncbi:MAG TPA: zinc metalloprotease HtpX, partial [Paracoccaceae bacterium]|nr:zinc metalloprotease HtpX [Paracoccaceae bacterium]